MKSLSKTSLRKERLLYSFLFALPVAVFSQPDIPIDPVLKGNSDSWKVKTKQKVFTQYKPAEVSFGPVKTIKTDAEKTQELSRDVSRDLFWKDIRTVNRRESSMLLLYAETDTIVVNMQAITVDEIHKRNTTGVILNADKSEDETIASQSWIDEMIIRSQTDSTQWHYAKPDSAGFVSCGCIGKLQSQTDSFFIRPVDNLSGKKMKDIMFSLPATGFIFWHEGKQVAALQLTLKRNAWISKDITPSARQTVLATITALFATIKTENGNGF